MRQSWKQWTWKQRAVFSAAMFPVGLVLFFFNLAADKPLPQLVVLVVIVTIGIPTIYILISANYAADRRHAEGDETAFSPQVRARMARNEAKRNGQA